MVCVRGQASMTSLPVASAKLLPIWTARAPQILHGECMGDPSKASSHVTISGLVEAAVSVGRQRFGMC